MSGPSFYTGLRFMLGALVVLVFSLAIPRQRSAIRAIPSNMALLRAGGLLGLITAVAISAQQIGLQYTKVANAGFITSLYVIFVPMLGLLAGHKTAWRTWLGAVLAMAGMYFLSVGEHFTVLSGDWYQLVCALVISVQVPAGRPALRGSTIRSPCRLSSSSSAGRSASRSQYPLEPISLAAIHAAMPVILYGGGLSVGVAYTIQVVAQERASPAHAAVIFSMEGLFAALAGWLVLGETLSPARDFRLRAEAGRLARLPVAAGAAARCHAAAEGAPVDSTGDASTLSALPRAEAR